MRRLPQLGYFNHYYPDVVEVVRYPLEVLVGMQRPRVQIRVFGIEWRVEGDPLKGDSVLLVIYHSVRGSQEHRRGESRPRTPKELLAVCWLVGNYHRTYAGILWRLGAIRLTVGDRSRHPLASTTGRVIVANKSSIHLMGELLRARGGGTRQPRHMLHNEDSVALVGAGG
jgi:hypothetical protein